jgi:hypothetical protein
VSRIVIRVCRLRPIEQSCRVPLGERGHQPLAPGVEADHPAGHATVGVLLLVHRGGGVAGEVGTGEFAECLVRAAVQEGSLERERSVETVAALTSAGGQY